MIFSLSFFKEDPETFLILGIEFFLIFIFPSLLQLSHIYIIKQQLFKQFAFILKLFFIPQTVNLIVMETSFSFYIYFILI